MGLPLPSLSRYEAPHQEEQAARVSCSLQLKLEEAKFLVRDTETSGISSSTSPPLIGGDPTPGVAESDGALIVLTQLVHRVQGLQLGRQTWKIRGSHKQQKEK